MNLQQLRYFIALCEERNFVLAARRCNVTQPSLTHSIRALEEEFGGPLFKRRPTHPTALGEVVPAWTPDEPARAIVSDSRRRAAARKGPQCNASRTAAVTAYAVLPVIAGCRITTAFRSAPL